MRKSFFYLYLAGAVISLALLFYQAVPVFPGFTNGVFLFNALITVLLGYLAFKASRPEKDRELM